jgi:hypothetical protein
MMVVSDRLLWRAAALAASGGLPGAGRLVGVASMIVVFVASMARRPRLVSA